MKKSPKRKDQKSKDISSVSSSSGSSSSSRRSSSSSSNSKGSSSQSEILTTKKQKTENSLKKSSKNDQKKHDSSKISKNKQSNLTSRESGELTSKKDSKFNKVKLSQQQGSSAQNTAKLKKSKQPSSKDDKKKATKAPKASKSQRQIFDEAQEEAQNERKGMNGIYTDKLSETFEKVSEKSEVILKLKDQGQKLAETIVKNFDQVQIPPEQLINLERKKYDYEQPNIKVISHVEQEQDPSKKPKNIIKELSKQNDGLDFTKDVELIKRPDKIPLLDKDKRKSEKSFIQCSPLIDPSKGCGSPATFVQPSMSNGMGSPVQSQRQARQTVNAKNASTELQIMARNQRMQTNAGIIQNIHNFNEQAQNNGRVVKNPLQGGKSPKAKHKASHEKYQKSNVIADPDLKLKQDPPPERVKRPYVKRMQQANPRLYSQAPASKNNIQSSNQKKRVVTQVENFVQTNKKRVAKAEDKSNQKRTNQFRESDDQIEEIQPLRTSVAGKKGRMQGKELMYLISIYMDLDPMQKKSTGKEKEKVAKKYLPSQILKKFQDLRQRLDYLDVDQIKYGMDQLVEQGKVEQVLRNRYSLKKFQQKQ